MLQKLTIKGIGIFLFGLCVFLSAVNAAPGELDMSFDADGIATTSIPGLNSGAKDLVIQADGRIIVAGYVRSENSNYDFALVRYHTSGNLDPSFGGDGIVLTDFSGGYDMIETVAIQADGKIIAAGRSRSEIGIARYNADGALDTTFGGDGKVTTVITGSFDIAVDLKIQADGKIVCIARNRASGENEDFAVLRYNASGTLDTTFDNDGIVTTTFPSVSDIATSLAIQPDGKIIAAGYIYLGGNDYDFAIARYNSNGSLDTSFDDDGKVLTNVLGSFDTLNDIALQPDGKIVAAGYSSNGFGYAFALVRYDASGALDLTFSDDGKIAMAVGGGNNAAKSLVIQPDGKILAAGYSTGTSGNNDFTLARFNSNGTLDSQSFGENGSIIFDVAGDDRISGIALDSIGRAVVVGNTGGDFGIARILGNISPTSAFSISGRISRANGRGIFNSFITLIDSAGNTQIARTNPFGYYRFSNVPVGAAVISVSSKSFTFENPTLNIDLTANLNDINFTAIE